MICLSFVGVMTQAYVIWQSLDKELMARRTQSDFPFHFAEYARNALLAIDVAREQLLENRTQLHFKQRNFLFAREVFHNLL